jgi:hypothetical protein
MGQEDYLKRQIDQLGKVLARILSDLKRNGFEGKASIRIEEINQELKKELNLDLFRFPGISDDQLVDIIDETRKNRLENLDKLAEIFYELASNLASEEYDKGFILSLYAKSLCLNEYIHERGTVFSFERQSRINEIRNRLKDSGLIIP